MYILVSILYFTMNFTAVLYTLCFTLYCTVCFSAVLYTVLYLACPVALFYIEQLTLAPAAPKLQVQTGLVLCVSE